MDKERIIKYWNRFADMSWDELKTERPRTGHSAKQLGMNEVEQSLIYVGWMMYRAMHEDSTLCSHPRNKTWRAAYIEHLRKRVSYIVTHNKASNSVYAVSTTYFTDDTIMSLMNDAPVTKEQMHVMIVTTLIATEVGSNA